MMTPVVDHVVPAPLGHSEKPTQADPEGLRVVPHTCHQREYGWPDERRPATVCAAILAILLAGLNSCTGHLLRSTPPSPTYKMKVDTIADPKALKQQTFFVLPGIEGVSERDLQFREFAVQVERALKFRGYRKVPAAEDAELIILLSYGIGAPRVEYELISRPIFGDVPALGHQQQRNTVRPPHMVPC
jgi:hypothetical protein